MPSFSKYRVWKVAHWLIGLFIVMFLFRLAYGFTLKDTAQGYDGMGDFFSGVDLRKNYASEKFAGKGGGEGPSPTMASSQKYEKTATTRSRSTSFEKDNAILNERIKAREGVVQYEQRSGNPGYRELHLLIGVDPERFDSFYADVQAIGRVRSTQVTKVDKTNEYRQLNAKKTSLEKTLASLNELRSSGGEITDFITLAEKIRGIESELQDLGVELGNFDTENEFCSVRFSLFEGVAETEISFIHRIKVALEWTLEYYALSIICITCASLAALVIAVLVDRLRRVLGTSEGRDQ